MATHGSGAGPNGYESLRAADNDRQRVADRLYSALHEGRLSLDEYDERVRCAYAARTYADLDGLLDDLPPAPGTGPVAVPLRHPPTPVAPAGMPPPRRSSTKLPTALMVLWTIWGGVVALNVVVWVLVCVTTSSLVYAWPARVAGPSGTVLLATTIGVQAIRRHRD